MAESQNFGLAACLSREKLVLLHGFVPSSVGVDRRLKNDPDVSQLDLRLKIRLDVPIFSVFY